MSEHFGCMDNSCRISPPKEMATNGGCRCFEGMELDKRIRLSRFISHQKSVIAKLREALEFYAIGCEEYMGEKARAVLAEIKDGEHG